MEGRAVGIWMPLGSGNGSWKVVLPPPLVTTTGPAPVVPPLLPVVPPVPVAGLLPLGVRPLTGVVEGAVLVTSGPSGFNTSVVGVVVASSPTSGRGGTTVRWRSAAR